MEYRSIRAFPVLPGPHILRDIINRQHSAQNRGFAPTFIRDIFLPIASSLIRLIACSATSISLVAILFGDQYTAGSPLSVGLASTFLKDSLMGTLRLMPLGGIGLRDHVSEIPFTAPPR